MNGRAQINIGTNDSPGAFINFLKGLNGLSFPAGADPSMLDADGYPKTTTGANIGGSAYLPSGFAGSTVDWVIKWPATRTVRIVINSTVTKSSSTFSTTAGGANSVLTIGGAGGRAVFRFNGYVSASASVYFPAGAFYAAGSGEIVLCRLSDEAAYDAGEYFSPEFLALLIDLNPKTIRPMGWSHNNGNGTNEVQWRYRSSPTSFSWSTSRFPPGCWGGTVSGTDTYTMAGATDTPVQWTDGEIIQAIVTNANTTTTPTLNVMGRGAKTITNTQGLALSAGSIVAGGLATFVYDGLLDKVIYSTNGITTSVPIEAQVQLCNRVGANLWAVLPTMADDNFVASWGTYIRDNLSSALSYYAEYSNELWNPSFPQTNWGYQRGLTLGFFDGNNEPSHGWYGLRCRQIMGALTSLWAGHSNLKRVMSWQAYGNSAQVSSYRLQGSDLASIANGGKGNATWTSWTGGANYRNSPDRPIDYTDVLSYATYYQGASFNDGNAYTLAKQPAANLAILQAMADNYSSGAVATALASLDADIRSGTNANNGNVQTLAELASRIYPTWETVAASFGKAVEAYEGGKQCLAPTAAQCTTLGLAVGGSAAAAATALANLLTAYNNDAAYQKLVADQFSQYLAEPQSQTPSWLNITGGGQWALLSGDIFSAPFQIYYGFKNYNNHKRRMVW